MTCIEIKYHGHAMNIIIDGQYIWNTPTLAKLCAYAAVLSLQTRQVGCVIEENNIQYCQQRFCLRGVQAEGSGSWGQSNSPINAPPPCQYRQSHPQVMNGSDLSRDSLVTRLYPTCLRKLYSRRSSWNYICETQSRDKNQTQAKVRCYSATSLWDTRLK